MKNAFYLLTLLAFCTTTLWAADGTPAARPTPAVHLSTFRIFTDKKDAVYIHPYPNDEVKSVVLFKGGKRWVDLKLKGTDQCGLYIGTEKKDITPYLENGALQFYIRGNKGGETLGAVGFRMGTDPKHKFNLASTVSLGDYCEVTTQWKSVIIPLNEFPKMGKYIESDEELHRQQKAMNLGITNSDEQLHIGHFDWNKVLELQFEHKPSDETEMEIEIANVVILPHYKLRAVVREKEEAQ